MSNKKGAERLISQRWPRLKKRAQNENNPEKLIAILEEIDDLLFNLEMRIASRNRSMPLGADAVPESAAFAFELPPPGSSESESQ
jgi:hypothetical protein